MTDGGARLAAERSEVERSGAKPRGCGLGRRNTDSGIFKKNKNLNFLFDMPKKNIIMQCIKFFLWQTKRKLMNQWLARFSHH